MTFLLGIQAMLGQEPPIYFRSITTARIPFLAKVQARYLPASPQPSTTRSYSSGCDMGFAFVELVSIRKASTADRKWNERAGIRACRLTQRIPIRSGCRCFQAALYRIGGTF